MLRLSLCVMLFAIAGCASALTAHREDVARAAVARTPLSMRLVEGNLRVLAPGALDDERATWMIDTGASAPNVTTQTAARHRAASSDRQTMVLGITGWANEETTAPIAVSMLDVRREEKLNVRDWDDGFEAVDVVGTISPQHLAAAGGAVELDLARLAFFRLSDGERQRATSELARTGVRLDHACGGADQCVPIAHVTIDGRAATLMVDTGSAVTVLFADSAAGVATAMRAKRHVYVWSDTNDPYDNLSIANGGQVRVGARTMSTKHLVVLPRPDGFGTDLDGMLGVDVLRGCAILLDGAARGAMACDSAGDVDTAPCLATLRDIPGPRYWPDQIAFEGLSASDEQAVRMELARRARSGVVLRDGTWDASPVVQGALGARAHAKTREDGKMLRVTVTF